MGKNKQKAERLQQSRDKLAHILANPPEWLIECAEKLRPRSTPAEGHLWSKLQYVSGWQDQTCIQRWIVDFYHPASQVAVELDGGIHASRDQIRKDAFKDIGLFRLGVRTIRFVNQQVFDDVDAVIHEMERVTNQAQMERQKRR